MDETNQINHPPVLSAISNQTVNEGSTLTFTATATDPDNNPLTFSLAPGAPAGATINPTTGQFSYTPNDGPGTFNVTVVVTDTAGLTDSKTFTITVNNIAPIAALSASSPVHVGQNVHVTFSNQFDPSSADMQAGFLYSFDFNNDGDFTDPGDVYRSTSAAADYAYTTTGTKTIHARIEDKDGGFTDYTTNVSITNNPPVLNAISNKTTNEGTTIGFTATASDPDMDPLTFSLGAGAPAGATINPTTGQFTYTPNDGPGTVNVTVIVTDAYGLTDSKTFSITINNVAPIAVFANGGSVRVGQPATVFFTNQFDPSSADTQAGFLYSYDFNNDGDFVDTGDVYHSSSATATFTFTTAGSKTIHGRIEDDDGGYTDYWTTVMVMP